MDMEILKETIKKENSIEEVIGEFLEVNKNNKAVCPFHEDKDPSLSINIKDKYFYCFGCGVGGDVFNFVMKYENLDFMGALKFLAKRKNIDISTLDNSKIEAMEKVYSKYSALGKASEYYFKSMPDNVRDYLIKERGLTQEIIKNKKIGFCKDNAFDIGKDCLNNAGLIYKETNNPYFKGFITFPNIYNGNVVYISGRKYGEKQHRKLKSEKVSLSHLYNENDCRNKEVIIAEGEIDTLTLLQNGYKVCGVLGTSSFKEEWAEKFKDCEVVYVSFDADEAGIKASQKIAELLPDKARIVFLPDGQDVNDYFKENTKEDFKKLLDNSLSLIEFKIKQIPFDTNKTKLPQILNPVLKEMAGLNIAQADAILRHTIKVHFNLTNDELKSYEKDLKNYRKEPKFEENKKSISNDELMEILHAGEDIRTIHPSQDFINNIMSFSVKIRDEFYIVTSDKRLFSYEGAEQEGFVLKHDTVDTTRFSYKGISSFIESKYDVNMHALYQKIYNYIKRFICFPSEEYLSYITLWTMGTYVFMIFRYYPYIWLNAEKGSGKTLLMEILSKIVYNGDLVTSTTESAIFREVSNDLPTMFIDEVEKLSKNDKDIYGAIISILNAGFNKSGCAKRVEKTSKGDFTVKKYNAFSPKMIAGINDIDDVLQDRTVRIQLLRKKDNETVERYKETAGILKLHENIRDELYIFALTYAKDIAEIYHSKDDVIEGMSHLNNRELDIHKISAIH